MTLNTITSTILSIAERQGFIYLFSTGGCDVYDLSTRQRVRQITASNVTCGCVNDDGVFLGTSDAGVYYAAHAVSGVVPARQLYATTTDLAILDDAITDIDGAGLSLIIAHGAGVSVVIDLAQIYSAVIDGGATLCAIGTTKISYTDGTTLYTEDIPTADWTVPTGSTATINSLQYVGDTLIAGTASGMDVGGTSVGSGSAWGMLNGDYLIWATSTGRTVTRVSDLTAIVTAATASALWVADDLSGAVADGELDQYLTTLLIPGSDVANVRRDWSLTCELTHSVLDLSAPTLTVNGTTVTATLTAITNGYRIEYAPAESSAAGARVTAVVTAADEDGNSHTVTWSWTCATVSATVTDKAIPSLVCLTDIGLASYQADETYGGVNIIWMDDQVSALHVDQDQCQAVGRALVERDVNHAQVLTLTSQDVDANGDSLAALEKGDLVTVYCPALALHDALAEVKAVQANSVAAENETIYTIIATVYERIAL